MGPTYMQAIWTVRSEEWGPLWAFISLLLCRLLLPARVAGGRNLIGRVSPSPSASHRSCPRRGAGRLPFPRLGFSGGVWRGECHEQGMCYSVGWMCSEGIGSRLFFFSIFLACGARSLGFYGDSPVWYWLLRADRMPILAVFCFIDPLDRRSLLFFSFWLGFWFLVSIRVGAECSALSSRVGFWWS